MCTANEGLYNLVFFMRVFKKVLRKSKNKEGQWDNIDLSCIFNPFSQ
jgi:hypothetical protein